MGTTILATKADYDGLAEQLAAIGRPVVVGFEATGIIIGRLRTGRYFAYLVIDGGAAVLRRTIRLRAQSVAFYIVARLSGGSIAELLFHRGGMRPRRFLV